MPHTDILVFREANGDCPCQVWLDDLETTNHDAYEKCLERILRLHELGNELRRPLADYLRDGIYELRAKVGRVHYRVLYFFHGSNIAVLSHGCTKEKEVPEKEIDLAVKRKALVKRAPNLHTVEFDLEDDE